MELTDIILETALLLRSHQSSHVRKLTGKNPYSLWVSPLKLMGKNMQIDSIVLYSPSKKGREFPRKDILRCSRKTWQELHMEQQVSGENTLLLSIEAPRKMRHRGTRPLCYLGFFKTAGFSQEELSAIKRVAEFFADNVYDNIYIKREQDAQNAISTIQTYDPTTSKPGSVAC